jgi:hypothetical protein
MVSYSCFVTVPQCRALDANGPAAMEKDAGAPMGMVMQAMPPLGMAMRAVGVIRLQANDAVNGLK